jgi:3-phenylpropionate/trans-cinnamate dioxygenase ferredoxin reductase subunit
LPASARLIDPLEPIGLETLEFTARYMQQAGRPVGSGWPMGRAGRMSSEPEGMKDGIVIVGAGHGGSQAAVSLRQEGYDGPLTLISAETDIPYHRPPLSKAFLKEPAAALQPLRAESVYADNRVQLRLGTRVAAIDVAGRVLALDGSAPQRFDSLILATGARPRRLDVPGSNLDGVFYLRSAGDARGLRGAIPAVRSVVVIGGGFVGLEVAASLAGLGKNVTVVEAADRLLARVVAPSVSEHMADVQRALGVRLLVDTGVERIEGQGAVAAVVTNSGERLAADIVVVGIGAEPNVELARDAGIACADGISVGAGLQTSAPGIYAIGDCATYHHWQVGRPIRLESVQNATDQARHVAGSILGRDQDYREVPWFWSDQGPVKLQMTGLALGADRHVASVIANGGFSVYHFRGDRLVAIESVNRPAEHMLGRRMLAAGFSPDDRLIAEGAAAMKAALAAA